MAIAQARHRAEDAGHQPIWVHAVFWNSVGHGSVAYALTEILDNLPHDLVERKLWCLWRHPDSVRDYHSLAFPDVVFRALNKLRVPAKAQGRLAAFIALRSIRAGDFVYMWPPYDLWLIKRAQRRGAIIVAERTNCMAQRGRAVLSRAYARRGLPLPDGWYPPEEVAEERELMLQCDYVTAANPLVAESLREAGLPPERILETSYGYSPERLAKAIEIERPSRAPVFAFVGLGIVRKGFDVLLEAWVKAGVDGVLLLAGELYEEDLRVAYADILARRDVKYLGYVKDIAAVYAAADVFVFPTHEEGGPQVTYEAAGCGLASIVSPMGAGRIVRDGSEGLIIDPLDVDQLAGAIVSLAENEELRRSMGKAAAQRAQDFRWAKVATRLYEQFFALRASRAG